MKGNTFSNIQMSVNSNQNLLDVCIIFITQTHVWDSSAFYYQQRLSVNLATDSYERLMFFLWFYINLENDKKLMLKLTILTLTST